MQDLLKVMLTVFMFLALMVLGTEPAAFEEGPKPLSSPYLSSFAICGTDSPCHDDAQCSEDCTTCQLPPTFLPAREFRVAEASSILNSQSMLAPCRLRSLDLKQTLLDPPRISLT